MFFNNSSRQTPPGTSHMPVGDEPDGRHSTAVVGSGQYGTMAQAERSPEVSIVVEHDGGARLDRPAQRDLAAHHVIVDIPEDSLLPADTGDSRRCLDRFVQFCSWAGIAAFTAGITAGSLGVSPVVSSGLILMGSVGFSTSEGISVMRLLCSDAPTAQKVLAAVSFLSNATAGVCSGVIFSDPWNTGRAALLLYLKGVLIGVAAAAGGMRTLLSALSRDAHQPMTAQELVFFLAGLGFSAGNILFAVGMMDGDMTPVQSSLTAIAGLGVFAASGAAVEWGSGLCCCPAPSGASAEAEAEPLLPSSPGGSVEDVQRILDEHGVSAAQVADAVMAAVLGQAQPEDVPSDGASSHTESSGGEGAGWQPASGVDPWDDRENGVHHEEGAVSSSSSSCCEVVCESPSPSPSV